MQGYNCEAVTSADGLIIAVSVNNNPADVITYTAMTAAAVQAAAVIANHRPTGTTGPATTCTAGIAQRASARRRPRPSHSDTTAIVSIACRRLIGRRRSWPAHQRMWAVRLCPPPASRDDSPQWVPADPRPEEWAHLSVEGCDGDR